MAEKSGKWQREYVPLDVDSVTRGWTRSESRDDGGAWKVRTVGGGISPTDARAAIRSSRLERLTPSPGQPIICLAPKRAWRIAVIGTPRVGERDDRPHGATSAQIATLKASLSSRPA